MAGLAGHRTARVSLAASSGSRSLLCVVPANTSISPDLASRTCTTTGSVGSPSGPGARFVRVPAALAADDAIVGAVAMTLAAVLAARPAPARPAAPRSTDRRDGVPGCSPPRERPALGRP